MSESSNLEFTGERVVPGLVDPNLFNEHLARYRFAARFAANARVLDAGCGTGYGTAELAGAAAIVAMDISAEAIAHARRSWAAPHVQFLQGTLEVFPFADASFDLIAAFEVIEHLEHWQQMLSEARRVLRPSGVLLVSTPNKSFYAESRAEAGPNPYHVHEFDYCEFEAALHAEFPHVRLYSQNHTETITFVPKLASFGSFDAPPDTDPQQAHFFLAACSQSPVPHPEAFGWLPSAGNVLRERQHHIALLEGEITKKNTWLAEAQNAQAGLQTSYDKLAAELSDSHAWAARLDSEMETARRLMDELRAEFQATCAAYEQRIAELEAEAAARLVWVRDLETRLDRGNSEIVRLQGLLAERTAWAQSLDNDLRQEREVFRGLQEEQQQTRQQLDRATAELQRTQAELAWINGSRWVRLGRSTGALKDRPDDPAE